MKRILWLLVPAYRALEQENKALRTRCAELEAACDRQLNAAAELAGQVELLTKQLAAAQAKRSSAAPLRPRNWSEVKKLLGENHDATR